MLFGRSESEDSSIARINPSTRRIRIAQRRFGRFLLTFPVLGAREIPNGTLCACDRGTLYAQFFRLRCNLSLEAISCVDELVYSTFQ
jgi:hypothetical protein